MSLNLIIASAAALVLSCSTTIAANTPCSGSKGGISHCMGHIFMCKNGTTSQSKKTCAQQGGGSDGNEGAKARSGGQRR